MRRLLGAALLRVGFWLLWSIDIKVELGRSVSQVEFDEITGRFGRYI